MMISSKRKRFSQLTILASYTLLICVSTYAGSFLETDLHEQVFPVIGKGIDTKLAAGLTIGLYPDNTTLSKVGTMVATLSETEKLNIPEYLLLKEHELAAQGNKEGILDLYATDNDKKFAKNERWVDIY